MEITWQTISLFVGLFVTLTAAQLKAFDWMLKRTIESFAETIERRLTKLEAELTEVRRDYIRRSEWMQEASQLAIKIDILTARLESTQAAVHTAIGGRDAKS